MKQILQADSTDNQILQLLAENDDHHFMDEQDETTEDYDRWINKKSFIGRWMRYWFSPGRVIFVNTPARKLPSKLSLCSSDDLYKVMKKAGFSSLERFGHAPYLYYPIMPRAGFIAAKS